MSEISCGGKIGKYVKEFSENWDDRTGISIVWLATEAFLTTFERNKVI